MDENCQAVLSVSVELIFSISKTTMSFYVLDASNFCCRFCYQSYFTERNSASSPGFTVFFFVAVIIIIIIIMAVVYLWMSHNLNISEASSMYQEKPNPIEKFLKYGQLMKSVLKISRVKIWTWAFTTALHSIKSTTKIEKNYGHLNISSSIYFIYFLKMVLFNRKCSFGQGQCLSDSAFNAINFLLYKLLLALL